MIIEQYDGSLYEGSQNWRTSRHIFRRNHTILSPERKYPHKRNSRHSTSTMNAQSNNHHDHRNRNDQDEVVEVHLIPSEDKKTEEELLSPMLQGFLKAGIRNEITDAHHHRIMAVMVRRQQVEDAASARGVAVIETPVVRNICLPEICIRREEDAFSW